MMVLWVFNLTADWIWAFTWTKFRNPGNTDTPDQTHCATEGKEQKALRLINIRHENLDTYT